MAFRCFRGALEVKMRGKSAGDGRNRRFRALFARRTADFKPFRAVSGLFQPYFHSKRLAEQQVQQVRQHSRGPEGVDAARAG